MTRLRPTREGQQARKWWSDADDMSLLTQVNIYLPFKQAKNTTKAWDAVANKLRQVHGFGRIGLDGKKASSRFYQLLWVHRKFQESSKYLSGVEQDETGKIMLLDELIQHFDEASEERQAERATMAAKATEKEATAGYVREQAMMRGPSKSNEGDDSTDSDVASRKRKLFSKLKSAKLRWNTSDSSLRSINLRWSYRKEKRTGWKESRNARTKEREMMT
ncbi:hypothetical protein H257_09478 [Aphanomyces astaci]|uniref:Myb-like domain-containing protein n=1 Tax=Aphanomyces astaci TaxID=112090 RepID=W4GBK6_APHAT|nr:hypothetical protein H257_09478 [Aphanomyces astaci]ETV76459.1 hypothetical protein H257_09478 [Aphanomyces astaci]|eukprot:XP_009834004.1 hypothetical protein H257_09478 [Aphanomyces astaci]